MDAFSKCHPAVNFLFFVGTIGLLVVIQHPAFLLAGVLTGAVYYLLLNGKKGWKTILGLLPMFCIVTAINPLLNTLGQTPLFFVFGRPYTLEALYYGGAMGGIFVAVMLWFGCYNKVLTSDKFTSLFGSLIPSISLLLVMVFRMIPNFIRKARQIAGARRSIGKGAGETATVREKCKDGMVVLSALTDWAMEDSVITGDSMRARGYGAAKRSNFQIYRMFRRDWLLLGLTLLLGLLTLLSGGKTAEFIPALQIEPLNWGFGAYCLYLLLPTALHLKEAITWRILRSKI